MRKFKILRQLNVLEKVQEKLDLHQNGFIVEEQLDLHKTRLNPFVIEDQLDLRR